MGVPPLSGGSPSALPSRRRVRENPCGRVNFSDTVVLGEQPVDEEDDLAVRRVAAGALAALRWPDDRLHGGFRRRAIELAAWGRLSDLLCPADRAAREVLTALRIVALRFAEPYPDLDLLTRTFLMFGYADGAALLRQTLPAAAAPVQQRMQEMIDRLEGTGHRSLACPPVTALPGDA
jgi:hypothetical protein